MCAVQTSSPPTPIRERHSEEPSRSEAREAPVFSPRRVGGSSAQEPRDVRAGACAVMDEPEWAPASPETQAEPWLPRCRERAEENVWAVVLAGGEGRRLQALTRSPHGVAVPKQFCRFRDDRSMLRVTLDRARRLVGPQRIVVVVTERHRPWWEGELGHLPPENVLVQPENRGTAVAILHALMRIRGRGRSPMLLVMPSDHDFDDEGVLLRRAQHALRIAAVFENDLVLLGIVPAHIDVEYGLIVPAPGEEQASRRVMTFVEKPSLSTAVRLMRHGAVWNSFIFACTGSALCRLYEEAAPALLAAYVEGAGAAAGDTEATSRLFRGLPTHDFSRDLLQREASRLRLIAVPPCGWTDLGTPARLAAWLDRHREAAFWRNCGFSGASGSADPPGGEWHERTA